MKFSFMDLDAKVQPIGCAAAGTTGVMEIKKNKPAVPGGGTQKVKRGYVNTGLCERPLFDMALESQGIYMDNYYIKLYGYVGGKTVFGYNIYRYIQYI